MDLAYVDESGSSGFSGSLTYSLGCVVVPARTWPDVLDDLIDFRRFLRASFGIPVRSELKANYLVRNGGPLRALPRPLSEAARFAIYRAHMRLLPKLDLRVFAVVVRKAEMRASGIAQDPRDLAWTGLLNRIERMSTKSSTPVMLLHDEGESRAIRILARRARRAGTAGSMYGSGFLKRPARLLVEDPVPLRSDQSYFVQLADLVAYAAYRRLYPPPSRVATPVVPESMWEEAGAALFDKVNMYSGGPTGLVTAP